jgi:hypothetical protein
VLGGAVADVFGPADSIQGAPAVRVYSRRVSVSTFSLASLA